MRTKTQGQRINRQSTFPSFPKGVKFAFGGFALLFVIFFVAIVGGGAVASTANEQTQTCTVEDKDRSTNQDGQSVYQVYTDCGVLRVEDHLIKGIFNSADIYGSIQIGETYDFTTVGYRVPVMSLFPTIIKVA